MIRDRMLHKSLKDSRLKEFIKKLKNDIKLVKQCSDLTDSL